MNRIFNFLSPGFFPFSLCIFLGVFILFYRIFNLPSPSELTQQIVKWYEIYGFIVVFISAIAESLFMLSIYLPGSLAIVLAVYSLGYSSQNLFIIGTIVVAGFTISNIVNYLLGKYGYYRLLLFFGKHDIIDDMQKRLEKRGLLTVFLTAFHPNFLAITLVCLGIGKIKFLKSLFYSFISATFWVTVWTIIVSKLVKKINLQDSNQSLYLLGGFFLWGVVLVIKNEIKKSKTKLQKE